MWCRGFSWLAACVVLLVDTSLAAAEDPHDRPSCPPFSAPVVRPEARPTPPVTAPSSPTSTPTAMVRLNFPNEVELKVLVDYLSARLGTRILYDEEVANKKVTLRAAGDVPVESLLGVLSSALKMKGLALVDAEVPGWKRIINSSKLASFAPTGDAQSVLAAQGTATAVTQAFVLKYTESQKVDQVVKTFLTQPGANSIAIKDPNVLIVTDYAQNLLKLAKLIELLDQPRPGVLVRFLPVRHLEAAALAQQVTALLAAKTKAQGDAGAGSSSVEIAADARTNQLVLVGSAVRVDEAIGLVQAFDVPLGLETRSYACRHVKPERVDKLAKQMLDSTDAKRLYHSAVDTEGGILLVTTTPELHAKIQAISSGMDLPAAAAQSPMRFHKLRNTTAEKVLETLRAMSGMEEGSSRRATSGATTNSTNHGLTADSLRLPLPPGQTQPAATAAHPDTTATARENLAAGLAGSRAAPGCLLAGAKVVADANTNSLIVWADPPTQRIYEELIRSLDRRRPQVLIEAKVITIDTSNDFALGVELSRGASLNPGQLLTFSSFGLSSVTSTTGALAITPGTGFNGAIVDSNIANCVIQAVTKNARSKVLASPRVLVNDNTKGQLESVLSVSYSSVNASQTVSTTSVGGTQDAGTTITVTPHISEGDHLQLEFAIEFSNFTASASSSSTVPPPRQVDKVQSTVTIPDGHTVIVGGLNHTTDSASYSGVPLLDRVPVVKYLFSHRASGATCSTLFVFLRPTILRDDKFQDLKFLSEENAASAGAGGQFPNSEPILMR